jgi:hypothetical protein
LLINLTVFGNARKLPESPRHCGRADILVKLMYRDKDQMLRAQCLVDVSHGLGFRLGANGSVIVAMHGAVDEDRL